MVCNILYSTSVQYQVLKSFKHVQQASDPSDPKWPAWPNQFTQAAEADWSESEWPRGAEMTHWVTQVTQVTAPIQKTRVPTTMKHQGNQMSKECKVGNMQNNQTNENIQKTKQMNFQISLNSQFLIFLRFLSPHWIFIFFKCSKFACPFLGHSKNRP